MEKYIFKQDLAEYSKLMSAFFMHLSRLSITFIALGVGLYSNLFNLKHNAWWLLISIVFLVISSILSVITHISYIETFRVPKLFSGFPLSNKIALRTIIPFVTFLIGIVCMFVFVIMNIIQQ